MRTRGFIAIAVMAAMLSLAAAAGAADAEGSAAEMVGFVRQGNIWVARVDGTGERRLTDFGVCGAPALSPDGKQAAFHCRGDQDIYPDTGIGQIYLVETAGGETRRLKFGGILAAEHPAFSPDGKSLVFVGLSEARKQGKEDEAQVFATMSVSVADIPSGKTRAVLRHKNSMLDAGAIYSNPAFSPDGQWILWQQSSSDVSGGFQIVDLKGKALFRFPSKGEDRTPSSPAQSALVHRPPSRGSPRIGRKAGSRRSSPMSSSTDPLQIILDELREFRREPKNGVSGLHARITKERKEIDAQLIEHDREIVTMKTRWRVLLAVVTVGFTALVAGIKEKILG